MLSFFKGNKLRINFNYISSQTELPPNIAIIQTDDRSEAYARMREAVLDTPVNTAVWLRPQESMQKLFAQCAYLAARKKFRKVFYDALQEDITFALKFGIQAGKSDLIAVDAIVDELAESSRVAESLWFKGNTRLNILSLKNYNRTSLDKHIDSFHLPTLRFVQPLLKPETILFDNNTFSVAKVTRDGKKLWKVFHDSPVDQERINGYLVPQGSIAAITDANLPHHPIIHAHGMTEGRAVPRMTTKLDIRL